MDAATFSREATACQRLLYHICWAMMHNEADCADAVQEALLRAWQRRDGLRDPSAFRPWLCRITANVCKDMLKAASRRCAPLDEGALDDSPAAPDPLCQPASFASDVVDVLHSLSDPPRTPVYLSLYEGYSAPEIAKMLGAPVNTVYSWIARGKKQLKEALS